jgi:transcriptional regulator with XRE-family HTH domain
LREQRAWSVADLARAARLDVETVARAEAGTTRPQSVTLRKLAAALGLEPAELATQLSGRGAVLVQQLQSSAGARICSIPDCPAPHIARGWCWRHYQRWRKHGDPLAWMRAPQLPKPKPPSKRLPLEQRFWTHVRKDAEGCWLWGGGTTVRGYGRFSVGPAREQVAHLFAYRLARGPLPPGHVLVNRCGQHTCVNPEHWQVSTKADVGRNNLARKRDAL